MGSLAYVCDLAAWLYTRGEGGMGTSVYSLIGRTFRRTHIRNNRPFILLQVRSWSWVLTLVNSPPPPPPPHTHTEKIELLLHFPSSIVSYTKLPVMATKIQEKDKLSFCTIVRQVLTSQYYVLPKNSLVFTCCPLSPSPRTIGPFLP